MELLVHSSQYSTFVCLFFKCKNLFCCKNKTADHGVLRYLIGVKTQSVVNDVKTSLPQISYLDYVRGQGYPVIREKLHWD
jgi:hypothetical protein